MSITLSELDLARLNAAYYKKNWAETTAAAMAQEARRAVDEHAKQNKAFDEQLAAANRSVNASFKSWNTETGEVQELPTPPSE